MAALWLAAGSGCQSNKSGSPLDSYGAGGEGTAGGQSAHHMTDAEVDSDGTIYYSPGAGGRKTQEAAAAAAPTRRGAPPQMAVPGGDTGGGNVLRVGDFLQVQLKGVPASEDASLEFSLNEDGIISMPHLPSIRAVGKTSGELEREIEEMYKSQRIFTNPKLSVMVGGRYINVMGEVRMPQRVLYTSDLTLLKAVAASGGFTDYANKRAVRIHRGNGVFEVHAGRALKDPRQDMPLRPGDTVEVRRSIF